MSNAGRIESLLRLLDDDNEQIGRTAITELLKLGPALDAHLAELQECDNPNVRRRIHQLQAIQLLRRRRRMFAALLKNRNINLLEGLIEVHLQWYDNDSAPALVDLWQNFSGAAEKFDLYNLEQVAYFMRKCSFTLPPDNEVPSPDYYCLGPVLDDRIGADILLCAVALELALECNLELCIVRLYGNFALIDRRGRILSPKNGWQVLAPTDPTNCEFWDDPRKVLKFLASMLFLYAVSSDSFRYIHTVGHALCGMADDELLEFLPYPYGAQPEES